MKTTIAILSTLDTKGAETGFLRDQVIAQGSDPMVLDIGVVGTPGIEAEVPRDQVAERGGTSLEDLLISPTREKAGPVMVQGALAIIQDGIRSGSIHGVVGLGGTQGTTSCCDVMGALPYGFPKIMVSTLASGDTSNFVGIKDITMMFSVSDILGLNPVTRKILANAAAAACGMARSSSSLTVEKTEKPLIGISNLGVLTKGTMKALEYFKEAGYEVIVFHAVGSGGRAMEQMMKEGIIGAVFDFAMGEIADDVWKVLRAGGPERLTVAGKLGLPQVLCPGGAEHLGILVDHNVVPDAYKNHKYVFHSPAVFVPRLNAEEMIRVADDICQRLQHTKGNAVFMLPKQGVGTYSTPGGVLHDPESDQAFFERLRERLPDTIELVERDTYAEDPVFVKECVDRLIGLIEAQ
ncbi:MAG: Tm-1-like ATP-binding domain-containing protein [Saprospiraceae bacterium]|nr:Tm-1-like ATP-binding domain-containing protein [Saprospiraceae bacterium]